MPIPSVPHSTYQQFRDATLNHSYDLDGYPVSQPYQCWDGVDLLYQQSDVGQYLYTSANVGGTDSGVKTCWTNTTCRGLNGSGHFSIVTNKNDIKRGDIIVFNAYSTWYGITGHIGFADEDYNGTDHINLLSQNFYGHHYMCVESAYLGFAFLGAFRYDAWNQPTPPPPVQSTKKKKFPFSVAWKYWWNLS